jgi:hypothetical protein
MLDQVRPMRWSSCPAERSIDKVLKSGAAGRAGADNLDVLPPRGSLPMKAPLAALLLGAVALTVHAEQQPDSQWLIRPTTLATLAQNGYKIVSVVSETNGDAMSGGSTDVFFLQRDQSVFKCVEQHAHQVKTQMSVGLFTCLELVQPFAIPRSK